MTDTPKRSSSLKLRILSALILAPLVLAVIIAGGWFFIAFVALGFVISVAEWARLALSLQSKRILSLVGGFLYIAASCAAYLYLRFAFPQGAWLALDVMVAIWASDSGAYFMGKTIGGRKMAPTISPNKTWAGFAGAVLFAGASLVLLTLLGHSLQAWLPTDMGLRTIHYPGLFAVGALLGAIGQAGDVLVSAFKRRAGLKDTGGLIPGHGGLLDRIDSLLLAVPVFLGIVVLWTL